MNLLKSTTPQSHRNTVDCIQNIFTLLPFLVLALGGGCAAVSTLPVTSMMGSPTASALEIHSGTEVRLQNANFIVTKTNVLGQSKGFSLLGVLTIVPAKFTTAASRLYTQAEMQQGRPRRWQTWSWRRTAYTSSCSPSPGQRSEPMSSSLSRPPRTSLHDHRDPKTERTVHEGLFAFALILWVNPVAGFVAPTPGRLTWTWRRSGLCLSGP